MRSVPDVTPAGSDGVDGVATATPRRTYELRLDPLRVATLERSPSWLIEDRGTTLSIRFSPEEGRPAGAEPGPANTETETETKSVVFDLDAWLGGLYALWSLVPAECAHRWMALLVEHRLLSHPELLFEGPYPPRSGGPPLGMLDAEALFDLHQRYESVAGASRPGQSSGQEIRCRGCREQDALGRAERAAKRDAWLAMGGRHRGGSGSWRDVFLDDPDPDPPESFPASEARHGCPHGEAGHAALRALCEVFPELAFELIQLLEPGLPDHEEGSEPRRFVLTKSVVEAILPSWLVDRAPAPGSSRPHELGWRGLRYVRAARGRPSPDEPAGASLSKGVLEGVGYAAQVWEMPGPVEELAIPPAARGEGPEPVPRLDEEVDATERLDVPVVLPE